jgi:hypothetical protein
MLSNCATALEKMLDDMDIDAFYTGQTYMIRNDLYQFVVHAIDDRTKYVIFEAELTRDEEDGEEWIQVRTVRQRKMSPTFVQMIEESLAIQIDPHYFDDDEEEDPQPISSRPSTPPPSRARWA